MTPINLIIRVSETAAFTHYIAQGLADEFKEARILYDSPSLKPNMPGSSGM